MRFISVPEDITVQTVAGAAPGAQPETLSFRKYALLVWLDDDRAIEGGFSKQVRWGKVLEAFAADASPGRVLQLEDEDYATLRAIVERPARRLSASITVQLLAFSRAVIDAPDKLPAHFLAAPAEH